MWWPIKSNTPRNCNSEDTLEGDFVHRTRQGVNSLPCQGRCYCTVHPWAWWAHFGGIEVLGGDPVATERQDTYVHLCAGGRCGACGLIGRRARARVTLTIWRRSGMLVAPIRMNFLAVVLPIPWTRHRKAIARVIPSIASGTRRSSAT